MLEFSVSVVVFHSDPALLARCLSCLERAVVTLERVRRDGVRVSLALIDNGALPGEKSTVALPEFDSASQSLFRVQMLTEQGNVGYGRGHNLGIAGARSDYHLILNPDVEMAPDALLEAVSFLDQHDDVIALSPRTTGSNGELQYLCRRYPTVADLFVRGFLPRRWRKHFDRRLAAYEMRAELNEAESGIPGQHGRAFIQPAIISGCFMLFKTSALQRLNGFDARYFLYFEDYDLSLRAGRMGRLAYVPTVRILHHGGGASRKGGRHIRMFVKSAAQFFNRFGWRWL